MTDKEERKLRMQSMYLPYVVLYSLAEDFEVWTVSTSAGRLPVTIEIHRIKYVPVF